MKYEFAWATLKRCWQKERFIPKEPNEEEESSSFAKWALIRVPMSMNILLPFSCEFKKVVALIARGGILVSFLRRRTVLARKTLVRPPERRQEVGGEKRSELRCLDGDDEPSCFVISRDARGSQRKRTLHKHMQ